MARSRAVAAPQPCPCGAPDYAACCGRYHGGAPAPDALALMRSRYSAYVLRDEAYLRATWHHSTRPAAGLLDPDESLRWLGLEVKSTLRLRKRNPDAGSSQGMRRDCVEFVARYRVGGRAHRLHEISRFVQEQGCWFYLDGIFSE